MQRREFLKQLGLTALVAALPITVDISNDETLATAGKRGAAVGGSLRDFLSRLVTPTDAARKKMAELGIIAMDFGFISNEMEYWYTRDCGVTWSKL